MSEYRAIYKCRLCGEEFERFSFKYIAEAQTYMSNMCVQYGGNNFPYEHHFCKNGNIGFADFIGCRKVGGKDESD